jgi:hypothetical protein
VEGFAEDGWSIEVASWQHSCHGHLRKFAEAKGKFISLDSHYPNISFIKHGRRVSPL